MASGRRRSELSRRMQRQGGGVRSSPCVERFRQEDAAPLAAGVGLQDERWPTLLPPHAPTTPPQSVSLQRCMQVVQVVQAVQAVQVVQAVLEARRRGGEARGVSGSGGDNSSGGIGLPATGTNS